MRVLVACEFSQIVQQAFFNKGCDSWSCDIKPTIGPDPDHHLLCDVREVLFDDWDLVIAHPPCTYLSNAGQGRWSEARRPFMEAAVKFFMMFYNLPGRVCIENPMPMKRCGLPVPSFIVQPYEYGDEYSKRTYLWLRRLPPFMPKCLDVPKYSLCAKYRDASRRSIFSPGIAAAMAEAWCDL